MPELSRFQGMIIKLVFLDNEKHHKPHIHVYYGDYEASIGIDGGLCSKRNSFFKNKTARIGGIGKMYIVNDIAYAEDFDNKNLKVIDLKVITELCMLVTFSNGEKRIFDAEYLVKLPVYKKLKDFEIFKNAYIENGIIIWDNGNIDIGVYEIYNHSYIYEQQIAT